MSLLLILILPCLGHASPLAVCQCLEDMTWQGFRQSVLILPPDQKDMFGVCCALSIGHLRPVNLYTAFPNYYTFCFTHDLFS